MGTFLVFLVVKLAVDRFKIQAAVLLIFNPTFSYFYLIKLKSISINNRHVKNYFKNIAKNIKAQIK